MQVYSIPKVLEAWGHFYYVFHWGSLAMMLARFVVPRKRRAPQGASKTDSSAAAAQQNDAPARTKGSNGQAQACDERDL